jgi:2-C-methyl-D-erythritol 2,4-cyclodiphosphate synthase
MGDIGRHFPDTDPAYQGISSLSMLEEVTGWMKREGFQLNNLDATIVAETPKLAPHLPVMERFISGVLETPPDHINIKATTTEGMGFCGKGEGIEAYAVASLVAM